MALIGDHQHYIFPDELEAAECQWFTVIGWKPVAT